MHSLFRLACTLGIVFLAAVACAAEPTAQTNPRRPIREFDIDTACMLGREIYRHDQLAWIATDVLLAGVTKETLAAERVSGWVVDTSGPSVVVRFLRQQRDTSEAAYDVVFAKGEKPRLSVPENRELLPAQLARTRALKSAKQAMGEGKYPSCGGSPNFVVLQDPEKDGLLVYVLRPKQKVDEIPVGGHYRVSVSVDGLTVNQVDQLFASCLTLSKTAPADAEPGSALLFMSHIVSARPIETHVFLSLQDGVPFMVRTDGGKLWHVNGGRFTPVNLEQK